MNFATVGTGWIVDAFLEGASRLPEFSLRGVYSRSFEAGAAFAARHGGARVYTSLEELAAAPDIEAVYVASPNLLHHRQSKLLLEAGKHVLCEKPITTYPHQLRELQALADSRGLVYLEAIMLMHLPQLPLLREEMEKIGRITTARFDFSQYSSKYPDYLAGGLPNIFNPKMETGCLMDLGIYCVYAALELFGKPERIHATAGLLESGADAYGSSVFVYDDKQVTLGYSKIGESRLGSEILGDKGTLTVSSISKLTGIMLTDLSGERTQLVGDIPKAELMGAEAADFIRYIRQPEETREDYRNACDRALSVCETLEEIRRQSGIVFE